MASEGSPWDFSSRLRVFPVLVKINRKYDVDVLRVSSKSDPWIPSAYVSSNMALSSSVAPTGARVEREGARWLIRRWANPLQHTPSRLFLDLQRRLRSRNRGLRSAFFLPSGAPCHRLRRGVGNPGACRSG